VDLRVSTTHGQHEIKVLIRSLTGEYLAGTEGQWRLTKDRSTAIVCDYVRDCIADQLQRLERTEGLILLAEPVNPKESYESCDRCGRHVAPVHAHFDGRHFFCPECRNHALP